MKKYFYFILIFNVFELLPAVTVEVMYDEFPGYGIGKSSKGRPLTENKAVEVLYDKDFMFAYDQEKTRYGYINPKKTINNIETKITKAEGEGK